MKLFWWRTEPNFGDLLNPIIMSVITGKKPVYAKPSYCNMVAIGSVLHLFLDRFSCRPLHLFARKYLRPIVNVWGTGIVNTTSQTICDVNGVNADFYRRMVFYALRGELSLRFVSQLGFDTDDIALGDPGLLVEPLLKINLGEKKTSCAFVPHYTEWSCQKKLSEYKELVRRIPSSTIIDVRRPVDEVIREIVAAKTLVSTALHGLIVADSFGIPNIRYLPKQPLSGTDFKFRDYYSVYETHGRETGVGFDTLMAEKDVPSMVSDLYQVDKAEVKYIQNRILSKFPYKVSKI